MPPKSFCQRLQVFETFVSIQTNPKKCKWKQLLGRTSLCNSHIYRVLISNLVSVGLPGRGAWLWKTLPEFSQLKVGHTCMCDQTEGLCEQQRRPLEQKEGQEKIMRVIWSAARLPVRIPRSALWTPHQHNHTMNCIINWDLPNKEQPPHMGTHTRTHQETDTHGT